MANFNQTLETIYAGGLAAELDEKLTEVVRAAELTGKVGSISVTLKIKAKGSSGQIEITPAVIQKQEEHFEVLAAACDIREAIDAAMREANHD